MIYGGISPHSQWDAMDIEHAMVILVTACLKVSTLIPGCTTGDSSELIRTVEGFSLTTSGESETSLRNNEILPHKFEAAISIKQSDGYKPLLILLMIQKEIEIHKMTDFKAVLLSDDSGNEIKYNCFDDLEPVFQKNGFDFEEARQYAVALGLAKELVNFQNINSDLENQYF